jgi:hypothetical protein
MAYLSPAAALAKALGTLCFQCGRMNFYWRICEGHRDPRCYYCLELIRFPLFEFGDHMYEMAVRGDPDLTEVEVLMQAVNVAHNPWA